MWYPTADELPKEVGGRTAGRLEDLAPSRPASTLRNSGNSRRALVLETPPGSSLHEGTTASGVIMPKTSSPAPASLHLSMRASMSAAVRAVLAFEAPMRYGKARVALVTGRWLLTCSTE